MSDPTAEAEPLEREPHREREPEPDAPRAGRLALETGGVALVAWAWAAVLYRVWNMPMRLPYDDRSDATLISAMVKTIEERGWYLNQPRLGAPFGQQFYDFPHGGETLQLAIMKVLVWVTGDWGLAINAYILGGFGVLAAVTFVVLRLLRFGPVVAGIGALAYSFMPYHFAHGEAHLWRSTYYSVPLACLLLVWVSAWRERFLTAPDLRGRGSVRGNLRWGRVAVALGIAVVIAGTETMATGFTISLLAASAVVAAIRWREPARLVVAGVVIVVMGATFVVLSYPTLHYYRTYGTNDRAARRLVTESELYGLKLSRLVTPQGGHRSETLSKIGARAQERSSVPSEAGQALGILGTAGFVGALYGALGGLWSRRRDPDEVDADAVRDRDLRPPWHRRLLREQATTVTLLAFLLGTIGGASVLLAMVGFSQIRVWDRIVLFIAFFAMVVVCGWGERFATWVRGRTARAPLVLALSAVAVLAFGLWDSTPPVRPPVEEVEARHAGDRAFVSRIEKAMPDDAAIFQLPVLPFPEEKPPGRMVDYDPLRGYLADDGSLRWSYGSIKGRPAADWQVHLRNKVGPVGGLPGLLGLGFQGIWLDTFGYETGHDQDIAELTRVLGEPIRSDDGRFLFWDLRPYRQSLDLTDEQLRDEARRTLHVDPPETP